MREPRLPGTSERSPVDAEVTDAELVERARRDPAAFAPLYARYADPIYRYCLTRLGDRAEAEDATSLVFSRVWSALPRYQESDSFRSWLFTIAHNTIANVHRDRARRPDHPLDAARDLVDAGSEGSPEARAVVADERRALTAALARLAPDQRRVIELRLAGLNGPEIADALGLSHASVKMLQLRAVDRLQALLAVESAGQTREGPDAP